MNYKRFEDLPCWQKARELSQRVFEISNEQNFKKDFSLKDQICRAAVSVPSNTAEGYKRNSPRDFVRFLNIAKGSIGELRTQLYITRELGYLEKEIFKEYRLMKHKKGGDIMPIASQYAVLSKDGKTLVLPEDVQSWLRGVDRFVVVMEDDRLILKKAHSQLTLEEMVTIEKAPLSDEKLNELIHESRK
jgi:four helix bundle protein